MARNGRSPLGRAALLVLAGAAIAIAAWQAGRTTERRAVRGVEGARPAVSPSAPDVDSRIAPPPPADELGPADPETTEQRAAGEEREATFVLPVREVEERPTAVPYRAPEARPADTPARCLALQAHPSSVSAYGRGGEVVQLVVRAQNGCGTNFGGASFRVTAIGSNGREVASAFGRFAAAIPPGGSAETLVVIPTKPSMTLTYRAEANW
jgi:hypothetical protein